MRPAVPNYTDKFAWGLRVNPTYEELMGVARKKPLRLPLPDREAQWYANSVYRSFLLDQAKKYNDYEHLRLDYDQSGALLPQRAAAVRNSGLDEHPTWERQANFTQGMQEQHAYEMAFDAMDAEHRQETAEIRRQQLGSYAPTTSHWNIEAQHEDLEDAGVPHQAPVYRTPMIHSPWPTASVQWAAAGQPQPPQFPTFERLNMGQQRRYTPSSWSGSRAGSSYERLRDDAQGR